MPSLAQELVVELLEVGSSMEVALQRLLVPQVVGLELVLVLEKEAPQLFEEVEILWPFASHRRQSYLDVSCLLQGVPKQSSWCCDPQRKLFPYRLFFVPILVANR